ncbi:hypothetical protein HWV62_12608 [Athelia sp. TMB]|nr:hypothetical protein HWV62_12608 [Athelia sp. TMB]
MVITSDSTGSSTDIESALASPSKKVRPAVYPNTNAANKPLNRSAAKRESVMTLGSIEHLQHYFTKTGIAAKKNPLMNKPRNGFVPAIGPAHPILPHPHTHTRSVSSKDIDLPPSPIIPQAVATPFPPGPHVKAPETDPATLLPGVIADLRGVAQVWGIDVHAENMEEGATVDVLDVLKTTTRAVRAVRNYVLSLPDDTALHLPRSQGKRAGEKAKRESENDKDHMIRRAALEVLTTLRLLEEKARVPLSDDAYDAQSDPASPPTHNHQLPSTPIRQPSPSIAVSGPGPGSASPSPTRPVDPDVTYTYLQIPGRPAVPVWENYEDDSHSEEEDTDKNKTRWDELLVMASGGGGWLYRGNFTLKDLEEERVAVGGWLDVVDAALFGAEGGEAGSEVGRGWDREREKLRKREREAEGKRRASAPMSEFRFPPPRPPGGRRAVSAGPAMFGMGTTLTEEPEEDFQDSSNPDPNFWGGAGRQISAITDDREEVDDLDLPSWARRVSMEPLARTHALIAAHLPPALLPFLPRLEDEGGREGLLQALASGQLLCAAYNGAVRRSRRPWGFISADAVHDVLALEAEAAKTGNKRDSGASLPGEKEKEGKKTWTFRRTDNLRLWAAALKLRYLLPIVAPPVPVSLPNPGTPLAHTSPLPSTRHFPSPALPPLSPGPSPAASHITSPQEDASKELEPEIRGREARAREGIVFDASRVARREVGWEDMLESVLKVWMNAVVGERRGER